MQKKQTRAALGRHQRSRMPSKSAFGNGSFTAHPNPPAAARYLILFSLAIHAANAAPRFSPSSSRTCGSIVDFSSVAAKTASAVVTIRSEKLLSYPYFWPKSLKQLLPESPDLYIWSGSGVIVDSRGYILTNLHVVEGAPHVRVRLPSHRDVEPMFIAKDPHTDLAVLKVKAQALPFIPLGNSDDLRVGEWVLAIGSPFGEILAHTITAGIVSAKSRSNLGLLEHDELIQVDAAINPGNSGGALVNVHGELVGITAAFLNRAGIPTGVAFAIPVNRAGTVLQTVIQEGRISRGSIGASAQDLTPELAEALSVPQRPAAVLSSVVQDGPAKKAGLARGDAVIALDGKPVRNGAELRHRIATTPPGNKVAIDFFRGGMLERVEVRLVERPTEPGEAGTPRQTLKPVDRLELGLELQPLSSRWADELGYHGLRGLLVLRVTPGGAGERADLLPGDLIESVNGQAFDAVEDFMRFAQSYEGKKPLLLLVRNRSGEKLAAIKVR